MRVFHRCNLMYHCLDMWFVCACTCRYRFFKCREYSDCLCPWGVENKPLLLQQVGRSVGQLLRHVDMHLSFLSCRHPYFLLCQEFNRDMQSRKLKYVLIVNSVFLGAGSVFLYSDASPFPVSVTSVAEGPACGTVLSGRSSCSCPGTLCQCLFPELWHRSTHRTGWSILLLEASSPGKLSRYLFGTEGFGEILFVQFWQIEVISFLWHFLWTCNSTLITANLMQHWKEKYCFSLSPVHPWLNFKNHMAEMMTSSCDHSLFGWCFCCHLLCCLLRPRGGSERGAGMAAWQASRFSSSSAPTTPPSLKTSWRNWTWKLTVLYRYLQQPCVYN